MFNFMMLSGTNVRSTKLNKFQLLMYKTQMFDFRADSLLFRTESVCDVLTEAYLFKNSSHSLALFILQPLCRNSGLVRTGSAVKTS